MIQPKSSPKASLTLEPHRRPETVADAGASTQAAKRGLKISTVSHTLDAAVAERLRHFAFRERISESAVIEFSLRTFFDSGNDAQLGAQLREAGAALRRKR